MATVEVASFPDTVLVVDDEPVVVEIPGTETEAVHGQLQRVVRQLKDHLRLLREGGSP